MGDYASRRQWKAAVRQVESAIPAGETVRATGPAAFLFIAPGTGMWVDACIAVTERRLVWALPKSRKAGAVSMLFDRIVKYEDREPGVVAITERDPEYAAMLGDPSNPHGEVDAVFRFDGYEPQTSAAIRSAIESAVRREAVAAGSIPHPRTGYSLPMFSADEKEFGPTTPLEDGLRFGESLIPWSDLEKAVVPRPGTIIFHFPPGSEWSMSPLGFGIRVDELGDAESAWLDFLDDHGVRVEDKR
jgi:hypothetical protein